METQLFVVFDTKPIPMVCLQCKESITTKIDTELGWLVWSAAGVLCLTGLWSFLCKKVTHSCLIYVNFRLQIGLINPYIRARISLIKVYDRAPICLIHAYMWGPLRMSFMVATLQWHCRTECEVFYSTET